VKMSYNIVTLATSGALLPYPTKGVRILYIIV
jgi:hypothetical protein